MILCHFFAEYSACPRARAISYNAAGPISALGFKSTTLAQLMSRYATSDPNLISSASDKRKAPFLVAPPAAKKKRTSKRLLIEVNIYFFLSIKPLFILTISSCIIFRPESNNHQLLQNLPMPHLLVRSSPFSFLLRTILFIGIYPLLVICRGNIGESNCGEFFSSTYFKPSFTKNPVIFSSSRSSNFTRDLAIPFSSRSSSFTRDGSIFYSARSFKPTKDSTNFSSVRSFSFTRDPSKFSSTDHLGASS
jgi:hypothetical protein